MKAAPKREMTLSPRPILKMNFDQELSRGAGSFNGRLGQWWYSQANNSVHKYAYRNIANYLKASLAHPPKRIIDYACGAGNLLFHLAQQFPHAHLIGLDGSSFLLDHARRKTARLSRQMLPPIRFIETTLPNFLLPRMRADVIIFAFPNMASFPGEELLWVTGAHLGFGDKAIARDLTRFRNSEEAFDTEDPEAASFALLRNRLISLSLRRLIKSGGICLRIEYGNMHRQELTKSELMQVAFEEGSLDNPVNGRKVKSWFRVLASSYFRSRVLEDVYQQTGDVNDKKGGYLITVLRAI
jgi:SAM-dependent methyltransferase